MRRSVVPTPDAGIQAQLRNIEATYGNRSTNGST
jgi:hypothetical protein